MGPVGHIDDITKLIKYTRSLMKVDRQSSDNVCRTFCIIVGDYGRSHGLCHRPAMLCTTYPLSFVHKDDPAQMTFRSQHNHPTSYAADVLLVHQLLAQDCPSHEYTRDRCHRCLLIPRRVYFSPDLFPQIVIPRKHAWHHTVTPSREKKFPLLPLAHSQAQTHYSLAHLVI